MQPLLLVSEESQFLLRILNGSFQTLDIIKDRIVHAFADLFCSKANLDVIDLRQDNVVQSVNREDWSSKGNNSNREGDSTVGFNVLDAMLKHSLDRLKSMRERIPSAEGISNCTLEINFNKDAYVIRAMCLDGKLAPALSLWCNMIQNGTIPDVITHNYLINGLCKNGELEKAEWIVRGMLYRGPAPSCATYNSLIRGYCLMNDVDKGLNTFSTMANHGIIPNRVTCNILVHALCKKGLMEEAKKLFHKLLSKNYEGGSSDLITSTIMMDGCFKNGDTDQALAFWERMLKKGMKLDKMSYNVVVHGFCMSHDVGTAYKYCCEMLKLGFVPDVYSYNTIVGALCKEGKTSDACYIYDVMTRMGVSPDQITYKMIIQALCINREIDRANCFLDYMLENSIIPEPLVWNVIIDGYGRCGDIQKASYIRDKMVANGVLPNIYTYNALIYAQIKSGNLSAAQSLEKEMLSYGLIPDSVTYNLLIGAACNLGLIHSALKLHDEMLRKGCQPDVITYTELLKWYCLQGRMTEADKLFGKLLSSGLAVDHVPFLILGPEVSPVATAVFVFRRCKCVQGETVIAAYHSVKLKNFFIVRGAKYTRIFTVPGFAAYHLILGIVYAFVEWRNRLKPFKSTGDDQDVLTSRPCFELFVITCCNHEVLHWKTAVVSFGPTQEVKADDEKPMSNELKIYWLVSGI
ncbi:hypothetical protein K7X08_029092 [Anisodus acutangulus]|uniref:Pentatricopeptide repeat-containing protein n=1 Tax=Anisodus acutangulus TaxID=402998 RepID=A0A9Q1L1E8_9SOLA|nr:hypothetical protein K7X08_029092 [Anisodus acutangulus]